jgi:hypothetical protein
VGDVLRALDLTAQLSLVGVCLVLAGGALWIVEAALADRPATRRGGRPSSPAWPTPVASTTRRSRR